MAIGLYYTMEFTNVEDVFVKVLIGDTTVEAEVPQIIPLDPAGDPLRISTIDNAENKFSSIKGQQAAITFHSNGDTSLLTFADGPDDRFPVTILYGTTIIFYGFLSLADNQEAFLPPRNEVTLIANDKLGALKDIPLTDFDGENPEGKYTIGQLVAMCLQKTGLSLQLRVINNLRHGTGVKSFQATFGSPSAIAILMDNANTQFFYIGQRVSITGTASNNIEFTVLNVGTGFVGVIVSDTAFTLEADVIATFTDVTTADHFYNGTYLDAKTFEEEIGVSENCYDVLSKILGYDCFLVQYKECWWICRVDEYEDNPFYVARFDENGEFIDIYEEINLSKNLGKDETHWFEGEATVILPTRPIKLDKLTFNYNYPLEIICNQSFERGEFIEDLSSETNEDGVEEQVKSYTLDCWDSLSVGPGGVTLAAYDEPPISGSELYVKKFYFRDEERRRELIIKATAGTGNGRSYMKSQPIELTIKDLIQLTVNVDYSNIGGSSGFLNTPVLVGLFANSGNIYFWKAHDESNPDAPQTWNLTSGIAPANWYLGAAIDEGRTEMSYEAPPLPESGKVYIYLINQYGEEVTAHYDQPEITITPFVNGSYRLYKGRYDKVERTAEGYLAKIEDEVFISDTFGKTLKGAMHFFANDNYQLTVQWYNAARYALGSPPDFTVVKPFGWIQAYSVWNQYRLSNRIFQTQLQGFGEDIPSLVHKYLITDSSPHSVNRYFLMLTCEKDLFKCNMTGTIEQVYHTEDGKSYDDPHEFKYIS